jgi:hypothetical protein
MTRLRACCVVHGSVWVLGDAEALQIAVADLEREQHLGLS